MPTLTVGPATVAVLACIGLFIYACIRIVLLLKTWEQRDRIVDALIKLTEHELETYRTMSAEDPRYSQLMINVSDAERDLRDYELDRPAYQLLREQRVLMWSFVGGTLFMLLEWVL